MNSAYTDNLMITYSQALSLINQYVKPLAPEVVELKQATGRISAELLTSNTAIPEFANSAMDGFALSFEQLQANNDRQEIELPVLETLAAGEVSNEAIRDPLGVCKIMTGAPVPEGFDTVIPVEQTQSSGDQVKLLKRPVKGANVRLAGEDFHTGDTLLESGCKINQQHLMALAANGIGNIQVAGRPTVAFFATGKELVDDFNQALAPGQIRNSNRPYVTRWLEQYPVELVHEETNRDDVDSFVESLSQQVQSGTHLILSTGAVSMGDFDFIPRVIKQLEGEIIFHKCQIKPGKPILFAKFPSGSYYIGLPGNPISTAIGLRFFVHHLLMKLLAACPAPWLSAELTNRYKKNPGFRHFLKAKASISENGKLQVKILDGQESFKIKPMLDANGWAVAPEESAELSVGSMLDFVPFNPWGIFN